MTFNEAVSMCKRIESYTIGSIIKDMKIDFLWIGPTNKEDWCDYMNSQIQKGQEVTLLEFPKMSFSVYGVSIEKTAYDIPKHIMINLDQYEKMVCN